MTFFKQSNVDLNVLKQIWALSTPLAIMNKAQFYCALRYIQLCQNEIPISKERLVNSANASLPLPKFGNLVIPPMPKKNTGNYPAITPENHIRYHELFMQYDSNHDGYLSGQEAVFIFSKSGLGVDVLKKIWVLSDQDKDNRLTSKEFCVAFHLIVCVGKHSFQVPEVLPQELLTFLLNAPLEPSSVGSPESNSSSPSGSESSRASSTSTSPQPTTPVRPPNDQRQTHSAENSVSPKPLPKTERNVGSPVTLQKSSHVPAEDKFAVSSKSISSTSVESPVSAAKVIAMATAAAATVAPVHNSPKSVDLFTRVSSDSKNGQQNMYGNARVEISQAKDSGTKQVSAAAMSANVSVAPVAKKGPSVAQVNGRSTSNTIVASPKAMVEVTNASDDVIKVATSRLQENGTLIAETSEQVNAFLSSLNSRLAKGKDSLNTYGEIVSKAKEALLRSIKTAEKETSDRVTRLEEASQELVFLEEDFAEVRVLSAQLNDKREKGVLEEAELNKKRDIVFAKINLVREDLSDSFAKLTSMPAKLIKSADEVSAFKTTLQNMVKDTSNVKAETKKASMELSGLKVLLQQLGKDKDDILIALQKYEAKMIDLESQCRISDANVRTKEAELAVLQSKQDSVQIERSNALQEVAASQAANAALIAKLDALASTSSEYENRIAAMQTEKEVLAASLNSESSGSNQVKEKVKYFENLSTIREEERVALQGKVQQLERAAEKDTVAIRRNEGQIAALRADLEQNRLKDATAAARERRLEAEVEELKRTVQELMTAQKQVTVSVEQCQVIKSSLSSLDATSGDSSDESEINTTDQVIPILQTYQELPDTNTYNTGGFDDFGGESSAAVSAPVVSDADGFGSGGFDDFGGESSVAVSASVVSDADGFGSGGFDDFGGESSVAVSSAAVSAPVVSDADGFGSGGFDDSFAASPSPSPHSSVRFEPVDESSVFGSDFGDSAIARPPSPSTSAPKSPPKPPKAKPPKLIPVVAPVAPKGALVPVETSSFGHDTFGYDDGFGSSSTPAVPASGVPTSKAGTAQPSGFDDFDSAFGDSTSDPFASSGETGGKGTDSFGFDDW